MSSTPSSPADHAPELSSISSALDDLTRRLTAIAESLAGTRGDWMAQDLFEVERTLVGAGRRLADVGQALREPGRTRD